MFKEFSPWKDNNTSNWLWTREKPQTSVTVEDFNIGFYFPGGMNGPRGFLSPNEPKCYNCSDLEDPSRFLVWYYEFLRWFADESPHHHAYCSLTKEEFAKYVSDPDRRLVEGAISAMEKDFSKDIKFYLCEEFDAEKYGLVGHIPRHVFELRVAANFLREYDELKVEKEFKDLQKYASYGNCSNLVYFMLAHQFDAQNILGVIGLNLGTRVKSDKKPVFLEIWKKYNSWPTDYVTKPAQLIVHCNRLAKDLRGADVLIDINE